MNRAGAAVGYYTDDHGNEQPCLWRPGRVGAPLPVLHSSGGMAHGINASGEIVGMAFTTDHDIHAVWWRGNRLTDLGGPAGGIAKAQDVNDAGLIVGSTMWPDSRRTSWPRGRWRATYWRGGRAHYLSTPEGADSFANGVDRKGIVVGSVQLQDSGESYACLWVNDRAVPLRGVPVGPPGMRALAALGINARGDVLCDVFAPGAGGRNPPGLVLERLR